MNPNRARAGRFGTALAVMLAAALGLSACGGGSSAGSAGEDSKLNVVGFSVIKSAYDDLGEQFAKTTEGSGTTFASSYGASGAQSRAVIAGQKADVVAFSLEPDLTAVVDAGKVAAGWNSGPTKGIASSSVVVIAFRKGNPKGIKGWADIVKPGVKIVTADPGTSGAAKWNLLAAYTQAAQGEKDPAAGAAYTTAFAKNVVTWAESGRVATDTFAKGTGDVLISYENEAIAARAAGTELDYIVPDTSFLIQNPAAVTTTAPAKAKAFLDYVESADGQKILAGHGFRPVVDGVTPGTVEGANDPADPFPTVKNLITIDDLGGWSVANKKYFDKADGIITKIRAA
ncbi:sulfate ABC transporter substrate-binding protein [Spongisporangium articulatum]|uniref:Sulfate ABC transporter substrate-binding protein n=1 Tax=Spongisporangium articulatum TaxID=3362603 RepID=A0ABW8AJ63_9ACTN